MTIEKQTDGNYIITDGKVFADLQPVNVMDYVRNFLIGDATDVRTLQIQNIHPMDLPTRRAEYEVRRVDAERRIR